MRFLRFVVAASVATLAAAPAAAQPYTVIELSLPAGQTEAYATDINNRFQIVGSAGGEVMTAGRMEA